MTSILPSAPKALRLLARCVPVYASWLLALFCAASPVFAQYHFDSWTTDNGLPQNSIQAIVQDQVGYLWLATFDGLARFDGYHFTVFNKSNSPGLNSNRLTALYEDSHRDLWIGTEASGVAVSRGGRFTAYTSRQGLPDSQVLGISGDARGNVWVLSGEKIVRWSDGRFVAVPNNFPSGLSFASYVIGRHGRAGFWGVNRTALFHFEGGRLERWTPGDGLPSLNIESMAEDQEGALWVITEDSGIVRITPGKIVKVYGYGSGVPTNWSWFIPGPKIKLFTKTTRGEIWVIDLDSGSRHLLTRHAPPGLVNPDRRVLFEGVEGNLWVGTEGGGLYRSRKQAITVYSQKQGLRDHNIYPTYQDSKGVIWIGAWPGSVTRFINGKITNYTSRDGLHAQISALYPDRAGNLWVATGDALQILRDGRFTTPPATRPIFRALYSVSVIYQDREGTLWFGGLGGLARYKNGAFQVYSRKDGMGAGDVKVILEDEKGNLWIGGYGGVACLNGGVFKNYTEQDGLPSNTVRALYEDRDGVLWIGTYDGGLGRFKDGKFTRYTTLNGLFNNGVFQILEDSQGYLWMSCNHGIYRVRKQELNEFAAGKRSTITSIAYGKSDGMLSVECNGGPWPAGIKAQDGKLWFPTQDGVAVVDPATVSINLRPPPIVIESCQVDRAPRAVDRPVRIKPGQDDFEIQYTALSFVNSDQIQFKYKLLGLDHNWVDAGPRRTAYYSHVPPGRYVFKVIAANSDGVWNTAGETLPVIVLPRFYRTWWFITLDSLIAVGALVLAWQYRVAQLKRANELQVAFSRQLIASQEAERQRIAAELHDSLGQHLLLIKNWAMLALTALRSPDPAVKEPLTEISTTVSQAVDEVRGIAYNLRPYQLEKLGLTTAIQDLVDQVAASSAIQLTAEIGRLDGLFSKEAEISIYRIVQESLNNIVRHSQATTARILVTHRGGVVELSIEDNGRGFAPPDGNTPQPGRKGFGLLGIAERVRMLGGHVAIQSVPGGGSAISISLKPQPAQ